MKLPDGLLVQKVVCQMMGGDITVESEPGRGSTFTILLPRIVELRRKRCFPIDPLQNSQFDRPLDHKFWLRGTTEWRCNFAAFAQVG